MVQKRAGTILLSLIAGFFYGAAMGASLGMGFDSGTWIVAGLIGMSVGLSLGIPIAVKPPGLPLLTAALAGCALLWSLIAATTPGLHGIWLGAWFASLTLFCIALAVLCANAPPATRNSPPGGGE